MATKQQSDSQRQIVRQSSAKLVLSWAESCDKCFSLKELIGITEVFSDYVQYGYTSELSERISSIQTHIDNNGTLS